MLGKLLDGRYKIIQVLGFGGFGHTFIAENIRIPGNPKCVVKQLKPASNDPNTFAIAKRLFRSEAESLAKLGKHNQIPSILDFFDENQEFYLVQELIEGHPLTTELTPGKRLSESYAIAVLKDILPILEFIHQQNVYHRDIKPANIIRRQHDGKLVLIDFGAVKQVHGLAPDTKLMSQSIAIGTPGYMPVEQGRGQPRPCSDIYALGMIAIEALTGICPGNLQEDSQTGEILWQHYVPVSTGLAEILTKMIRYHFKERYQSAGEVLQALQQLQNVAPTPRVTPNPPISVPTVEVHELTLEWVEAGQTKTRIISDRQSSKNPGTVRIGRDFHQCDIVLPDPTVSKLHAEIFFNQLQQCFYVRNLRPSNPPVVDEKPLQTGEVVLNQGSHLLFGQLLLKVTAIATQHYSPGYQPTEYNIPPVNPSPHTLPPTIQPTKGEEIEVTLKISPKDAARGASKEITFNRTVYVNGNPVSEIKKLTVNIPPGSVDGMRLQLQEEGNEGLNGGSAGDVYVCLVVSKASPQVVSVTPINSPIIPRSPSKSRFSLLMAAGASLTAVAVFSIVIFNQTSANRSNSTISSSSSNRSRSPNRFQVLEQCSLINPTVGNSANVREQPDRSALVIRKLSRETRVTAIAQSGAFTQIQTLDNNTTGWVFSDQLKDCPS